MWIRRAKEFSECLTRRWIKTVSASRWRRRRRQPESLYRGGAKVDKRWAFACTAVEEGREKGYVVVIKEVPPPPSPSCSFIINLPPSPCRLLSWTAAAVASRTEKLTSVPKRYIQNSEKARNAGIYREREKVRVRGANNKFCFPSGFSTSYSNYKPVFCSVETLY